MFKVLLPRDWLVWAAYDVGLFGFYTATFNTQLQLWWFDAAVKEGVSSAHATALWSLGISVAMTASAATAPLLGWVADLWGVRRLLLIGASGMCCILTLASICALFGDLSSIMPGWKGAGYGGGGIYTALILAAAGGACYNCAAPLYNSFLPSLAKGEPDARSQLSLLSTWISNLGSGLLLLLLSTTDLANSPQQWVTIACLAFAIAAGPLILLIPEPCEEPAPVAQKSSQDAEGDVASRWTWWRERWHTHRDLFTFLVSNLLLCEASSVIYWSAGVYARAAAGIQPATIVSATVSNRLFAVPFTFIWFGLRGDGASGAMRCYKAALGFVLAAGALCLVLTTPWEYYCVQMLLAAAGTGSFAFSRTVLASLAPPGASARVFGMMVMLGRAGGSFGPLIYASVVQSTGSVRWGFAAIAGIFCIGMSLLSLVDADRGARSAVNTPALPPAGHDAELPPPSLQHTPLVRPHTPEATKAYDTVGVQCP